MAADTMITASDMIRDSVETRVLHKLHWANMAYEFFSALLVELPGISPENLRYKLIVQESHRDRFSDHGRVWTKLKILYEQSFATVSAVAFNFNNWCLWVHDQVENSLVIVKVSRHFLNGKFDG